MRKRKPMPHKAAIRTVRLLDQSRHADSCVLEPPGSGAAVASELGRERSLGVSMAKDICETDAKTESDNDSG